MSESAMPLEIGTAEFEEVVLNAPAEVAVVVDFWAPWCAPCRTLAPVLERVVASLGKWARLVKVNVDENTELAGALRVQSIPAVKIFRGGQLVGEFVGALAETRVRAELEAVVGGEADEIAAEGDRLLVEGRAQEAETKFREALEADPKSDRARVRLARILLDRDEVEEARGLAAAVEPGSDEETLAKALLAEIRLCEECEAAGGADECRSRLDADGSDLAARYGLGCCLAAEGDHKGALDELLRVVEADRGFRDGAARSAMVAIFSIVGQRSPLAEDYRARLTRLLY